MPPLEPLIAGRWTGHTLWLQFTGGEAPDGWCVEINVRRNAEAPDRWVKLDAGRSRKSWLVVPIWREGHLVQARVQVNGAEGEPEMAEECEFLKCRCVLAIQAGVKPLRYPEGTMLHAPVDGAACGYQTRQEVDLAPGERAEVEAESLISSGFAQLDHEGHFDLRPGNGVRIWNTAPSENDVRRTGRDFTVLARLPMDGPVALVRKQPVNPVVR